MGRAVGCALAAIALLVACTSSSDPGADPTESATAAESETSTESTTDDQAEPDADDDVGPETGDATDTDAEGLPEETDDLQPPVGSDGGTVEDAEKFFRYFIDVANEAHLEPKVGVIDALASEVCEFCVIMETRVGELVSFEERAAEPMYEVTSIEPIDGGGKGVQLFKIRLTVPANKVLDASGETVESNGEFVMSGQGSVIWDGTSWMVLELTLG